MLIDSAVIFVQSGKGGDGHVSFYRGKYLPKGGPDGGDGGDGGSVYLHANPGVNTLLDMKGRHHWRAEPGQAGSKKQKHGKNGSDLVIELPPGTLVYNDETGDLIVDLDEPEMMYPIAQGGKGGFGNEHFKSPTNQAPRDWTPGEEAVELTIRLELKILADVGLVGKPNAGKSTLLSRISAAKPKIADYPFTTLEPNLGIATLSGYRRLVVADIPGVIEGAHEGTGLGIQFLRHIERTSVLIHLLEIEPGDGSDPVENYHTIRNELEGYSQLLADKPQLVAISKMDLLMTDEDRQTAKDLIESEINQPVIPISSPSGIGIDELLEACWEIVQENKARIAKQKQAEKIESESETIDEEEE